MIIDMNQEAKKTAKAGDAAGQDEALRAAIRSAYRTDEDQCLAALLDAVQWSDEQEARTAALARSLIEKARSAPKRSTSLDSLLSQFPLAEKEGIALMCLAEALLRIPDAPNIDRLIRDKLMTGAWEQHVGRGGSLVTNASAWALVLTGKVLRFTAEDRRALAGLMAGLVRRIGEPIIRQALHQAMRVLSEQFIVGSTIEKAIARATGYEKLGYLFSYDMLGEAARTKEDALRYWTAYRDAIVAIGKIGVGRPVSHRPGVSIKLSALHPRYEYTQRRRVLAELAPRLASLVLAAKAGGIGVTVDAEEAERLDLSLDIFEAVFAEPGLAGWDGFGLVVQAYSKRSPYVLDWLARLARRHGRRIMIRLVKGGYWDTEIKAAQVQGVADYPVFTRKLCTDVSYVRCAQRLLSEPEAFYPMFATHNARTIATILELAKGRRDFEFQRLHGMGEELYAHVVPDAAFGIPCRVYAPVGAYDDLLPYLVRRLIENGSTTSFVNAMADGRTLVERLIRDPLAGARQLKSAAHPRIPRPPAIFGAERPNSKGVDLANSIVREPLYDEVMRLAAGGDWAAAPIPGARGPGDAAFAPFDARLRIGAVAQATPEEVEAALARAEAAYSAWDASGFDRRAACLDRLAELIERDYPHLISLLVHEVGKTIPDAVAEIREAVDFCRYYALRARSDLGETQSLAAVTGERNELSHHGRGVFACISPWNFPIAIFTGQIVAALVTGNAVIAKPAEQTPLTGAAVMRLMLEAGIPEGVVNFLPGLGETVGAALTRDPRIAGVAFTGSTETAQMIARSLAGRSAPLARLIAETGGLNCLIADSSALPEQVVRDAVTSAFLTTGQRCSALRLLFLQEEVAPRVLDILAGAMDDLMVGDPRKLETDIGPVIDAQARDALLAHAERMSHAGRLISAAKLPPEAELGCFVAPAIFEIPDAKLLEREVFGPILHVVRFRREDLDAVIDEVNRTRYGLTMGVHSRIDETVEHIRRRARVGNLYVNRDIIGARVGCQPFGGEGFSGTGPKAGGAAYLAAFCTERVCSVDTTATGGNAALASLSDDEDAA